MNWSVAIAQLIVTAIMTILRAMVCGGLVLDEKISRKLPKGYELDWTAKDLEGCDNCNMISWGLKDSDHCLPGGIAEKVIDAKCRLAELSRWESQWKERTDIISNAIVTTMNFVFANKEFDVKELLNEKRFEWRVVVEVCDAQSADSDEDK